MYVHVLLASVVHVRLHCFLINSAYRLFYGILSNCPVQDPALCRVTSNTEATKESV